MRYQYNPIKVREKRTGRAAIATQHADPDRYWILFDDAQSIGEWAYSKEDFEKIAEGTLKVAINFIESAHPICDFNTKSDNSK